MLRAFSQSTASGRLLFHILASVAEMECELIKERTYSALSCPYPQFHRLGKQPARASAQHLGQGIIDLVRLTKANNVDRVVHGVSLSVRGSGRLDTRLDTPPSNHRRHPDSVIAPWRSGWACAPAADRTKP